MFCHKCGEQLIDGATFCSKCGTATNLGETRKENLQKSSDTVDLLPEEYFQKGIAYLRSQDYENSVNFLTIAANCGVSQAMIILGKLLLRSKDYAQSFNWLQEAVKHGYSEAACILGDTMISWKENANDVAKGINWYQKAMSMGSSEGTAKLAIALFENYDRVLYRDDIIAFFSEALEKNNKYAFEYLRKVNPTKNSKAGKEELLSGLCKLLSQGNMERSLQQFSAAAEKLTKQESGSIDASPFSLEKINTMTRDDVCNYLYNNKSDEYLVNICDKILSFPKEMLDVSDVNYLFNKYACEGMKRFNDFYHLPKQTIHGVLTQGYDLAREILNKAAALSVSICSKYEKFDLTENHVLNNSSAVFFGHSNSPLEIWNERYHAVKKAYQAIQSVAARQKAEREYTKENRSRFVGVGFGLKGSVDSMIEAGALNMLTGAGYSIKNAVGNMATDIQKANSEQELYKDSSTFTMLIYGIFQAIETIKMDTINYIGMKDVYNPALREKCNAIVTNASNNHIQGENLKKALLEAFAKDPFNTDTYKIYIENYGDEDCGIQLLSKFLNMENDILLIKKEQFQIFLGKGVLHKGKELAENIQAGLPDSAERVYISEDYETVQHDLEKLEEFDKRLSFVNPTLSCLLVHMRLIMKAFEERKTGNAGGAAIAPMCYANTGMKEIEIPEGTEIIGDYAFAGCAELERVIFPNSLKEIGIGAFWGCKKAFNYGKKGVLVLPPHLLRVKHFAFYACDFQDIQEIAFPEGCEECALDAAVGVKFRLPDSIKSLVSFLAETDTVCSIAPHHETYIYQFFFSNNLMKNSGIFTADDIAYFLKKYNDTVIENIYSYNYATVTLPASTENEYKAWDSIDVEAFSKLSIATLVIERPVTYVGKNAFSGSNISTIKFKSDVITLEDQAFFDCAALEEVFFSKGIEKIGDEVFLGCPKLKYLILTHTVKDIGKNIINPSITQIICTDENSYAYQYCISNGIEVKLGSGDIHFDEAQKYKYGEKPNPKLAFEEYKKAADNEFSRAYFELANCYHSGFGTEKNVANAYYWYRMAHENGDKKAVGFYGYMKITGEGCSYPDRMEGLNLLCDAVNDGNAVAMNHLGMVYLNGHCGIRNLEEALRWFKHSMNGGNNDGKTNYELLLKQNPSLKDRLNPKQPAHISNREKTLNNLPAFLELLAGYTKNDGMIYYTGQSEKAKEKLTKAMDAYAHIQKGEIPIACFDPTVFGAADEGFLISSEGIYIHNDDEPTIFISFDEEGYYAHTLNAESKIEIRKYVLVEGSTDDYREEKLYIKNVGYSKEAVDHLRWVIKDCQNYLKREEYDFLMDSKNIATDMKATVKESSPMIKTQNDFVVSEEVQTSHIEGEHLEAPDIDKAVVMPNVEKLILVWQKQISVPGLYFKGQSSKGDKKIANAIQAYALDALRENVICVYDSTLFGSATDGFLITDKKIYVHELMQDKFSIDYKEINALNITEGNDFFELQSIMKHSDEIRIIETMINKKNKEIGNLLNLFINNLSKTFLTHNS